MGTLSGFPSQMRGVEPLDKVSRAGFVKGLQRRVV
jgi:hypothetical protein